VLNFTTFVSKWTVLDRFGDFVKQHVSDFKYVLVSIVLKNMYIFFHIRPKYYLLKFTFRCRLLCV